MTRTGWNKRRTRLTALLSATAVVVAAESASSTALPLSPSPSASAAAESAPQVTTSAGVLQELGINTPPGTYVFAIDTSRSMNDKIGGVTKFQQAKSLFTKVVASLSLSDFVTLYSFDDHPSGPLYNNTLGTGHRAPLAAFPRTVNGESNYTDIGAALDKASVLLAPVVGPQAVASVVLLTDGQQAAPPGSLYTKGGSAPWASLRQRFSKLRYGSVRGYAVPLSDGASGERELRAVLPSTTLITDVNAVVLSQYLTAQKQTWRWQQAAKILATDSTRAVTAGWARAPGGGARLTLTSGLQHIPVTMRNVTVSNPSAGTVYRTQTVTLPPGGSSVLEVPIPSVSGPLTVHGTLSSPWEMLVQSPAKVSLAQPLRGATWTPPAGSSPSQAWWPWLMLILVLAAIALLANRRRASGSHAAARTSRGLEPEGNLLLLLEDGEAVAVLLPDGDASISPESAKAVVRWDNKFRSGGECSWGDLLLRFDVVPGPRSGRGLDSKAPTALRVRNGDADITCPRVDSLAKPPNYADLTLGRANGVVCLYVAAGALPDSPGREMADAVV